MYHQAVQEFQRKSEEYLKFPTASNRHEIESQAALINKLKAKLDLSSHQLYQSNDTEVMMTKREKSSEFATTIKVTGGDMSPDSACILEEKRDVVAGLPPLQRSNPNCLAVAKKDSSLTRSHSDSFKKGRMEMNDRLRQGNSSDDISSLKLVNARTSVRNRYTERRGKIETEHSANSSDSAIDQISPASDSSIMAPVSSTSSLSSNNRREIMAIDDQEFQSDEENFNTQGGPFSDFSKLTQQPAHLAVFLHFLILNSDPSPVLFYLITESYRQGSLKEMRKWAYEIFSAFLVEKAPLKIHVDEQTVERIHTTLVTRHDKEDAMRSIFCQTCLQFVMPAIDYLLSDFRNKQSLGLGNLYGTHQLTEKQDAAELAKVIESTLWNHFDSFMANEEQERDAAMASALAFLFKQFSYTNMKNNLLERCSAFNAKEKNKFQMFSKPSKKVTFHLGHQLFPQQYYTMTNCIHCQNLLCGVGPQGYQCQKCEFNFHKLCKDNIKESCSGKKGQRLPPVVMDKPKPPITEKPKPPITEKPKPQTTVFGNKKKKQNSFNSSSSHAASAREENNSTANIFTRLVVQPEEDASSVAVSQNRAVDKSEPPKSADDGKSSPTSCRSRSPTETGSIDDKQIFMVSSDVAEHPKPLSTRDIENGHAADAVSLGKSSFSDSDLEAEADLPSLDSIIPKEQFKKLKPKEKKRQEVINELFHTEQAHVRNLKIMHRLFYEPMQNEQPALFVKLLFPNLDDMIEVHGNLNRDFKQKRKESENSVVGDFANILVRHFSDEQGLRFKTVCASFCEKQSHALELLKQRQRKDPKLAALLQETAGNSLCRRLELKDFLPTAMQRLTKYPLLIENLLKYTQVELEEYQLLQLAYRSSKEILNYVNKAVQDYENRLKLVELQKKIDKRPIESSNNPVVLEFKNLDLTNHILVYDGTLTWRLNRDRLINLHVVLLEGILLLLQKQDEKLVLRCQSTLIVAGKEDTKLTHSPIIKLSNVLIKPVATDKCAFFLVSTSAIGPQIYDLVAGSKDEKNKWCKRIMDAVEVFKLKNPVKPIVQPSKSLPPQASASQKNAEDPKFISPADLSEVTMTNESIACCPDEHLNHEPPEPPDTAVNEESLQQNKQELPTADEVSVDHQQSLSLSEYLDKIQDLDEDIRRSLSQKRELLLKLGQLPEEDFDFTLELPPLPAKNSDPKDVLLTMVTKSNCLAQHVDSLLMSDEPVIDSEVILDGDPPPLPPRNPIVSPTEALPPPLPPRLYRALPKLPISQLMDYCAWMNSNLSYLMRSFAKVEEENKQLTGLLRTAQEEFKLLLDEHESEDIHLNEQDSIDPPNFFTRETEFVAEACPGQGEFIIQANDSEIKNEHFFEPVLSDTEHVEISSACQALEEFDLKENVTEIEDGHTFESISTDPQNSFTSETKAVDSSASQEFTLQQYTEGQDCEMEISDRDDRDAKPDSNDDCETGVDFSITVQSIANIEDIDQAQDTEDSVTVVAETQFSDCVTDSIDCSDSVQHSSTEALIVPLENSEDFAT